MSIRASFSAGMVDSQPPPSQRWPGWTTSWDFTSRAMARLRRIWPGHRRGCALALLVCAVACASPATPPREVPVAGPEPGPRFAVGGPEADELGAAAGYPTGNRTTFYDVRSAVGSHSHMDELFPSRLVHKAPAPSRLARVAE